MNKMIETILNHKSIRKWKKQKIEKEIFDTLINVANRTATSNGLLQSSIIRITDQDKKDKLSLIANQPYLATAPELFIFVADNYRNDRILKEANIEPNYSADVDRLLQGITDSVLMAQNMVTAAEALGLGTVFFGSILNNPLETIKILNLPEKTMPVLGLGIGYPDQEPQIKPRIHIQSRFFENEYKIFENYHKELQEYDKELHEYYDLRDMNKKVDSFTDQVKSKMSVQNKIRSEYLKIAKDRGYNINI